jgi:hypothetical protein
MCRASIWFVALAAAVSAAAAATAAADGLLLATLPRSSWMEKEGRRGARVRVRVCVGGGGWQEGQHLAAKRYSATLKGTYLHHFPLHQCLLVDKRIPPRHLPWCEGMHRGNGERDEPESRLDDWTHTCVAWLLQASKA